MFNKWRRKREIKKSLKVLLDFELLKQDTFDIALNNPEQIPEMRHSLLKLKWEYIDDNELYNQVEQLEACIDLAIKERKSLNGRL